MTSYEIFGRCSSQLANEIFFFLEINENLVGELRRTAAKNLVAGHRQRPLAFTHKRARIKNLSGIFDPRDSSLHLRQMHPHSSEVQAVICHLSSSELQANLRDERKQASHS